MAVCGNLASGVAAELRGVYVEARTCQVYTGPCFANGEMGLSGKDAVMAWKIHAGDRDGIDLTGLSVALVVKADRTLGHQGFENADAIESMLVVDDRASELQRSALIDFVRDQASLATKSIARIETRPISLEFDFAELTSDLEVDGVVDLKTRKARPGDCICSNESAFYPPLTASLTGSVPGVTIEGNVRAPAFGTRWSIPDSRTAYLGTFAVD